MIFSVRVLALSAKCKYPLRVQESPLDPLGYEAFLWHGYPGWEREACS